MRIETLVPGLIDDLGRLLASDGSAAGCWCMWFMIPVKDYHAAGGAANEARFRELARVSSEALGLIAYSRGEPVGWAALGPRSRYRRALRIPTMAGSLRSEDDEVWLLPCLFTRPDRRRSGVARHLVESAVAEARTRGARALEAFPTTGTKQTSADRQVGTENLFAASGFHVVDRPSSNRVVMRVDF